MIKILVIDDDDFIRSMIVSALKKHGFEVSEAENGNVGIQLANDNTPDLVVTDILMPEKEGLETISEIKALNPDIKIIAISGGGSTKNMTFLNLAKEIGAHATLKKPFKPNTLLDEINNLINS